jgi:hypothetical protein
LVVFLATVFFAVFLAVDFLVVFFFVVDFFEVFFAPAEDSVSVCSAAGDSPASESLSFMVMVVSMTAFEVVIECRRGDTWPDRGSTHVRRASSVGLDLSRIPMHRTGRSVSRIAVTHRGFDQVIRGAVPIGPRFDSRSSISKRGRCSPACRSAIPGNPSSPHGAESPPEEAGFPGRRVDVTPLERRSRSPAVTGEGSSSVT